MQTDMLQRSQTSYIFIIEPVQSLQQPSAYGRVLISEEQVQTDKVSDQLRNMVEYLAATEPDISLKSWSRPKTELNSEYWTYIC